jgi:AraC-like DNA-binding protein
MLGKHARFREGRYKFLAIFSIKYTVCFGSSRRATGLKPKEYVQHLRVGRARETLEFSSLSINEISWKVGYEDPGAFRKVFQKIMGLSPGEYRRRFGIAETAQFERGTD